MPLFSHEATKYHKEIQSQSSRGVLQKRCYWNFAKLTGKHLYHGFFFNKVAGRPAILLKRRLWHRCVPVNFAKFLRTTFFTEHLRWLLLKTPQYPRKGGKSLPEYLIFQGSSVFVVSIKVLNTLMFPTKTHIFNILSYFASVPPNSNKQLRLAELLFFSWGHTIQDTSNSQAKASIRRSFLHRSSHGCLQTVKNRSIPPEVFY